MKNLCLMGLFLIAVETYAQTDQQQMKIGVINLKDCFDRYEKVKDLEEEMNNELEKLSNEQKKLEDEIQKAKDQYQGAPKDSTLKFEKYEQYMQKREELRIRREMDKYRMTEKTRKYRMAVFNDIMAVVRDIAKEQGYDIILKAEAPWSEEEEEKMSAELSLLYKTVLYYNSKFDITDTVVSKLNQEHQKKKSATNPSKPEKK